MASHTAVSRFDSSSGDCLLLFTDYKLRSIFDGPITFDRDARSLNDITRLKRQSKLIFTMEQYTPRERSEIVEIYIQQNKSIVKTLKLKNVKSAPSKNTIKRLYEKFSPGEALSNPKRPNKSRPRRSAEKIAAVRASVERSPRTSHKRRSQQLRMTRSTYYSR